MIAEHHARFSALHPDAKRTLTRLERELVRKRNAKIVGRQRKVKKIVKGRPTVSYVGYGTGHYGTAQYGGGGS